MKTSSATERTGRATAARWVEAGIVVVYFLCAILYVAPYKRAAKKAAKELLAKVNSNSVK